LRGLHSLAPFAAERVVASELIVPVAYDWLELTLVRSGTGRLVLDGLERSVEAGQVVLLLHNTPLGFAPEGQLEYTRVVINPEWFIDQLRWVRPDALEQASRQGAISLVYPEPVQILEPHLTRFIRACRLAARLEAITAQGAFAADPWSATALTTGVLGWLSPTATKHSPGAAGADGGAGSVARPAMPKAPYPELRREVTRACQLIQDRFAESCTLPWLARQVALSPGYLWRLFTEQVGKTPKAYRDMVRVVEMCRQLVARPDVPWTVIAREAGWTNKRSAAAAFQAGTTMTPGTYRRMLAGTVIGDHGGQNHTNCGADLTQFPY
ncbi:MAG: AraC family transcriptional regulator, partial [Bifidobacteriaceae bacterium]|nr:AraC family transcriptional regulator [Bifidobacteriaceae bacterium]